MGCFSGANNLIEYPVSVINISNVVTNGLQMYWDAARNFSYVSGNSQWNDISGNLNKPFTLRSNGYGNNGEQAPSAIVFSGEGGGSLLFDGINDFGTLGTSASPTANSPYTATSNITVCVWMKTTDGGDKGFWSHCNGGPVNLSYGIAGGKMRYWYYTAPWQTLDSNASINDGNWKFLVWAKSGTNMKQYINGSLDRDTTLVGDVTGPLYSLGSRWGPCNSDSYGAGTNSSGGSIFTGNLAIMMAYNRQLSQTEVSQNFQSFKTRFGL
jgi:hypothetical protein